MAKQKPVKLKKNEAIICEEIEDEGALLYNTTLKETHILNTTATLIFFLCDGRNISHIKNDYVQTFASSGIPENVLTTDFFETIDEFVKKNILIEILY